MGHPLIGDLTGLSTDELHKKYAEIVKRVHQAYRMGMGDAVQQLNMILEDYQAEINKRNDKMLSDMAEKSAEFKHIIDITR
jgi:hypothetical protein